MVFFFSGTGDSDYLQHLQTTITPTASCNASWEGVISETNICIGDGDVGACQVKSKENDINERSKAESKLRTFWLKSTLLTRVPDKRREFRTEFDSTGLEFEPHRGQSYRSWNSSRSQVDTLDILSGNLVQSRNPRSLSWNSCFLEFDSRFQDKNIQCFYTTITQWKNGWQYGQKHHLF